MYVITTADNEMYYISRGIFGITLTTKHENAQKFRLIRNAKRALSDYQKYWPDAKIIEV